MKIQKIIGILCCLLMAVSCGSGDDDWNVEEIDDDDVVYTYSVRGNRLTITESDGESVVFDKMVRE